MPGDLPQDPIPMVTAPDDYSGDEQQPDGDGMADDVDMSGHVDNMSDDDLDVHVHSGWLFVHESDSEEEEQVCVKHSKVTRTRICEERPEYQQLQREGLVDKPGGCSIGIHPAGQIWRAGASGATHHGRSFAATAGRTPRQALLRVVQLMLLDHLDKEPRDRLAKRQLQRVEDARAQEPSHKD